MKTLETEFTKKGWHHQQVAREGQVAIFRRWKDGGLPPHFEVVRIQQNQEREQFGVTIPAAESYPAETQWGRTGWTFPNLASAESRMSQEVAKCAEKAIR